MNPSVSLLVMSFGLPSRSWPSIPLTKLGNCEKAVSTHGAKKTGSTYLVRHYRVNSAKVLLILFDDFRDPGVQCPWELTKYRLSFVEIVLGNMR